MYMDPSESREEKKPKKTLILFLVCVALFITLLAGGFFFLASRNNPKIKKVSEIPPNAQYMAGEVIVQYEKGYAPGEEKHEEVFEKLSELGIISEEKLFQSTEPPLKYYYTLKFNKQLSVPETVQKIQALPGIVDSVPDYILEANKIPDDPLYSQQWGLPAIKAEKAWNRVEGENSITVAIVDSGVDYNHPDFKGRTILQGWDFSTCAVSIVDPNDRVVCIQPKPTDNDPMDESGHGTHVAGIVGAATNNGIGISGVTWETKILPVRVLAPAGWGTLAQILQGIEYSIFNGANVINLSLGGGGSCEIFDPLFKLAEEKNIVIVAGAGNSNEELKNNAPALCRGVITVGGTDKENIRAQFSNWGENVTISAPGVDILSLKASCTNPYCPSVEEAIDKNYILMSGTSMSTPYVSGAVALLQGANSKLSPSAIKKCLVDSADAIQTDLPIGKLLNIEKAFELCVPALPTSTPSPTPTPHIQVPSISPTPTEVLSAASCLVSLDSIDKKNKDYNLVTLKYLGSGGTVYVQMGQKGSMGTEKENRYSVDGFLSSNNGKAIGKTDLSKKTANNTGQLYSSNIIEVKPGIFGEPVFTFAPFNIYDWFKQFKKNPLVSNTSTNPSDFILGMDSAWWYLLSYCNGTSKLCSKNNIQVKIPKDISVFFFCSVRDNVTAGRDILMCNGNPICSYNDGPDVGIQPDFACDAWKRSCSATDFVFFDADSQGVNVGSFTPEN